VPQAEWRTGREDRNAVALDAVERLAGWNVRSSFVGLWFRAALDQLEAEDEARLVIDYDESAGLLSFDAWVGERRVYGADDFTG
jgi:hypothetical protein